MQGAEAAMGGCKVGFVTRGLFAFFVSLLSAMRCWGRECAPCKAMHEVLHKLLHGNGCNGCNQWMGARANHCIGIHAGRCTMIRANGFAGARANRCIGHRANHCTRIRAQHRLRTCRPSPSLQAPSIPTRSERDRSGGTAPRTRLHPRSVAAFPTLGFFRRGFGCLRHRAVALGSFRPRSAPAAPPCPAPQGAVRRGLLSAASDWSSAEINPAPLRAASAQARRRSSALSLARTPQPAPHLTPDWLKTRGGGPHLPSSSLSLAVVCGSSATLLVLARRSWSRLAGGRLRAPAGLRPPPPLRCIRGGLR